MSNTTVEPKVELDSSDKTINPPAPLQKSEHELTNEYDITTTQVNTVKETAATITTNLFVDVLAVTPEDVTKDSVTLVQRQLLADVVLIMKHRDWPVQREELTFNDVFDSFDAETAEDYFQKLSTRLTVGDPSSQGFINSRISRIYQHCNENSTVHEYVTTRNNTHPPENTCNEEQTTNQ